MTIPGPLKLEMKGNRFTATVGTDPKPYSFRHKGSWQENLRQLGNMIRTRKVYAGIGATR